MERGAFIEMETVRGINHASAVIARFFGCEAGDDSTHGGVAVDDRVVFVFCDFAELFDGF